MTLIDAFAKNGVNRLWNVTHLDNLESILKHGICSKYEVQRRGFGAKDISIWWAQKQRTQRAVEGSSHWCDPHDYVPLFIADNTPMLYVCVQKHAEDILLLEISASVLTCDGVLFSDGNIAVARTKIFADPDSLTQLRWSTIMGRWGATDPYAKAARATEVLIPKIVSSQHIVGLHIQNTTSPSVRTQISGILASLSLSQIVVKEDLTKTGLH